MGFKVVNKKDEWNLFYSRLLDKSVLSSYSYINAARKLENEGQCFGAIYEENNSFVFHPLIKRNITNSNDYFDLVSVYDYSGFWFNIDNAREKINLIKKLDKELTSYCLENNIITEFSRIYPFINIDDVKDSSYDINFHNNNVIVDLDDTYENIYLNYNPKRRNKINQSKKNNLKFVKENDINKFLEIYYKNLDRVTASQFYYFSINFFQEIKELCDIFYVYDNNNEICAGHIYLKDHNKYFLFLFAGVSEKLNLRPNCFAIDQAIQYSKSNKYQLFHLGSGNHKALQYYKESFSNKRIKYYIIKKIFDSQTYNLLTKKTIKEYSLTGSSSFFPMYRIYDLPYKPKEFNIE